MNLRVTREEPLRLMSVHAHPDDESSKGAATLAKYAAEGVDVLVVTCTGGERGTERDLVLVLVLKKNLPAGGGQAAALARILDHRDRDHPDPYLGHHWPTMD